MMQQNSIIKSLKALRNDPEMGSRSRQATDARRRLLLERIGAEDLSRPHYTFSDRFQYWTSAFSVAVLKPATVVLGLLVLAVGGWMTSVSAAYDAVPGDVLYPIKIASEQAQLTLATSAQQRAQLHMEFASRRLEEMNTISASSSSNKSAAITATAVAFKSEVSQATDAMKDLNATDAAQVASTLDAKADEYAAVINQTATQVGTQSQDASQAVASVQSDVKQAADAAVGVLVTTAEQQPDSGATADLKASFQKNLSDVDLRVKLNLGRIDVIKRTALNADGAVKLSNNQLKEVTEASDSLKHFDGMLNDAMNVFANGGYRSAFNTVSNIEATIDAVETQLADIELDIVSQQTAADEATVVVPPAATTETTTDVQPTVDAQTPSAQ